MHYGILYGNIKKLIHERDDIMQEDDVIEVRCGIFFDYYYGVPFGARIPVTADGRYEADSHRLEYETFVFRVINMMQYYKYELILEYAHDSHTNGCESMNFAFRQDKEILGKNARFIVFIRISEHPLYLGSTNIQNKEIYDDMKYEKYGLEHGDLLIDPIKVDARDEDSKSKAVKELITKIKAFASKETIRATELIE